MEHGFYKSVICRACGAGKGEPCKTKQGAPKYGYHVVRKRSARASSMDADETRKGAMERLVSALSDLVEIRIGIALRERGL